MTLHPSVTNTKSIKVYSTLESRFNLQHSNKFDYSKAVYVNNTTKMIITCPIHGEFYQTSANHLKSGCEQCGGRYSYNTEEFLNKAISVHGNRYDYSKTKYTKNDQNVIVTCKIHWDFKQIARNHLQGAGCPKCSATKVVRFNRKSLDQFKQDAQLIHGSTYDYTSTIYVNDNSKVNIVCNTHGTFSQTASDHLQGKGCFLCSMDSKGWGPKRYSNKSTLLYVLKLPNDLFKAGITCQPTIAERYSGDILYPCLYQTCFTNGEEAWHLEKKVLDYFKAYKYKGPDKFFKRTKNTEIISINPVNYIRNKL